MTRPLFDPSKMKGPEPALPGRDEGEPEPPGGGAAAVGGGAGAGGAMSVTQVAAVIAQALERAVPAKLLMVGEISGFTDRTHWYFRLKDDGAVIDCVMFAPAARKSGLAPVNGQKVVLSGRVEFYGKQGRTQFYATSMEAIGAGDLEQRFRALCAELKALGWFEPERKRPLPLFPRRVAVITSRTGAALQDVLVTMRRRCPAVDVLVVDVRVQGDGAAEQVARAVRRLSEQHESMGVDAVLVTRGGGSMEDLWAFNERAVAQAIVESRVPVVAAIGHETDVTIAELVADARAATPTQASMLLTPDRAALAEELSQWGRRLDLARRRRVEREREALSGKARRLMHAERRRLAAEAVRLERLSTRLAHARPEAVYAQRKALLAELSHRLRRSMQTRLEAADASALVVELRRAWAISMQRRRSTLEALERELVLASPISVLRRGYSMTTDEAGLALRSVSGVFEGQRVTTRLADGTFESIVGGGTPGAALQPAPDAPQMPARSKPEAVPKRTRGGGARRAGRGGSGGASQLDLF